MRNTIFVCLVVVLFLVSGCSGNTITAKPIAEIKQAEIELDVNVTGADPCEGVECGENEACDGGKCSCVAGFKHCDGKCISSDSCCKDSDCSDALVCDSGVCIETNCSYSMHYDLEKKDCVCDEGTTYCAAQKKCIPKKSCCMHASCGSRERCVPTLFRADICLLGDKKMCRSIMEERREVITAGTTNYNIDFIEALQGGVLSLLINEKEFRLAKGQNESLAENLTLYVESFELLGGNCKPD